jgi:hypothetical protein
MVGKQIGDRPATLSVQLRVDDAIHNLLVWYFHDPPEKPLNKTSPMAVECHATVRVLQ